VLIAELDSVFPWTLPAVNTPDNDAKGMFFFFRLIIIVTIYGTITIVVLLAFFFLSLSLTHKECTTPVNPPDIQPEAVQKVRLSNTRPTQMCTVPGLCCNNAHAACDRIILCSCAWRECVRFCVNKYARSD